MDRKIFPVNENIQSESEAHTSSLSASSSSTPCGFFETQEVPEGEHMTKSSIFTALPHVTDLTTYMIHDIISFSKSLLDFR